MNVYLWINREFHYMYRLKYYDDPLDVLIVLFLIYEWYHDDIVSF